jgi:two-component system, NarL family, invasion response regulator UvrY
MIRILIADDHAVVRRGLKQIIDEQEDLTVVGEAATAEELLAGLRTRPCDLVVTDIAMPGRSGLDALEEIVHAYPHLPVLVLSMHPEDQYGARVLKLGAAGYLTKDSAPTELVAAIRKILTGWKSVGSTPAEPPVLEAAIETERPRHETLSKRERTVLSLIGSGKSRKEIAGDLALSVKTIANYRNRILEKTAMKNTAQLMHYAISNRLVG